MILATLRASGSPRVRLLCIPFAGGGAHVFRPWAAHLPAHVELVGVRLPGRAERFGEPPFGQIAEAAAVIAAAVAELPPCPLVIYGHSMGAVLALEVTELLTARQVPPRHLVVAARRAPSVREPVEQLHALDEAALAARLRAMGGTPDVILDNPEMRALFFPPLRADLRMVETWRRDDACRLPVALTAVGGRQDQLVPLAHVEAWAAHAAAGFRIAALDAGHFFAVTHARELVGVLGPLL